MSKWRNQQGKIQVGCIVGVIVLVAALIIGLKTTPVLASIAEFQGAIEHEAERANIPRHSDKIIKENLIEKAEDLGLPVNPENIFVKRTKKKITVRVTYTYEIKYPGYTYSKEKVHEEIRPLF